MRKIYIVPSVIFEWIENEELLVPLSNVEVESGITEESGYQGPTINQEEGDGDDIGAKHGFFDFEL